MSILPFKMIQMDNKKIFSIELHPQNDDPGTKFDLRGFQIVPPVFSNNCRKITVGAKL